MDIQQNNVAVLHFNLVNQDGSTIFIRKTKLATFNLINPSAVSVPITDIGFDETLNQCWVRVPKASNAATGQYYGVLNIADDDWGTYTTSKIKVYSVVSDADEDTKSVVFTATCIATQVINPSGGNSPYYNTTTSTWWQYSDMLKAFEDTGVGNLKTELDQLAGEVSQKATTEVVNEIDNKIEEIDNKIVVKSKLDVEHQGTGWIKTDGTIESTTPPGGLYNIIDIPDGVTEFYLTCPSIDLTPDKGWALAWVADINGNMLSQVPSDSSHYPSVENLLISTYGIQSAAKIYITKTPFTLEIWDKNKKINEFVEQLAGEVSQKATTEVVNEIDNKIEEIDNKIVVKSKLDVEHQGTGWIKTDGTIASTPPGGLYNIIDIPDGVTEFYLTCSSSSLTPNVGWALAWVADINGNMLSQVPVDSSHYPSVENLLISTYGIQSAAKIYITKTPFTLEICDKNKKINEFVEQLDVRVTDLENKDSNLWKGKKIVWLGTSIPYGQGTDGTGQAPSTYPMRIGNNLGAEVLNVAQPGIAIETTDDFKPKTYGSLSLTISELQSAGVATVPYKSFENAMLGKDADLYVFDCEPNNSNWDLTDLENFNLNGWKYNDESSFESHRNSYVGAFLFLLNKLWTEKPSAKVVMVSEFISGADLDSKYQGTETSRAIAEKLRIPFIDVAKKLYYTPLNKSLYLNSDNVHPTQATHDRIAGILSNELLSIF